MATILILHGPNLNLLGLREPEVYGTTTLDDLDAMCRKWGSALSTEIETFQSNHEGDLIDRLHGARGAVDGIVINPGALSHYSYALHDAIVATEIPTVEVHISNIAQREAWRSVSVVAPACIHQIYGRGVEGYAWAIRHLVAAADWSPETIDYGVASQQMADLRIPTGEGPFPVAVLLHGGFWKNHWTRDLMDSLAVDLVREGIATWNMEYRRVGSSGGWPRTVQDVAKGIDHLANLATDHALDLSRVVVIGHSAGGHLGLWAAGRAHLAEGSGADPLIIPSLTVALAPVSDLAFARASDLGEGAVEAFLAGAHEHTTLYRGVSPIEMLPLETRLILVHGTDDDEVPVEMSDSFGQAAADAGDDVTYVRLEGVGHMDLIDPQSDAWQRTKGHISQFL